MSVNIISVFNNKGGVGKTTLTFHLAHALAALGKKVLLVDLDPQCNLTIYSKPVEEIQDLWDAEVSYIDEPGYGETRKRVSLRDFNALCSKPRTIHFLLKPTEEGTGELDTLPPPYRLSNNLDLIPGRLTLHMYEEMVARRWSEAFVGQPLAIRTLSEIRRLISAYADQHGYEFAIVDTSPSLGPLNKVILSTVDAFLIPCAPDLFSLYGIRNIGNSLSRWRTELKTLYSLIAPSRRPNLPTNFVRFLGYTIYNAKLRTGSSKWDMAIAHYNYAKQIPDVISDHIPDELSAGIAKKKLKLPIGGTAVMHSHNTYPTHAQKYHTPMWALPSHPRLEAEDQPTIRGNTPRYKQTKAAYEAFAIDMLDRLELSEGG
ncbi:ParA family protein [Tahibacter harae]|uniref:ParA family protein n=1 Tax=Tahibacter harae TaxID=2963937 RepID=A0ABT1QYV4_9GAMM|nr:ParA family protein [Tahibacter harae]MCQ4167456.1 ParA family protein [Tahibacter harae]